MTDKEQKAAEKEAAAHEKKRWDDFVKWHEEHGYTVVGTGFHDCRVEGIEQGPTYDDKPVS